MGGADWKKKKTARKEWRGLFIEIGARVVKSLLFWGLVTILASSIYGDIVRIREGAGAGAASRTEAKISSADAVTASRTEAEAGSIDAGTASRTEAEAGSADAGTASRIEAEADKADTEASPADAGGTAVSQEAESAAESKRAALTFDDGPHPVYTEKLLDGLKERNIRATFFVVGKNIPGNEDLIRRMEQEGHLIGNHTYDHVKICDMSSEDACAQVEKTSALVREITGHDTEFVRPPFGAWNKNMECSFVMIPVLWDVDPLDWTTKNTGTVVQRVLEDVEDGDIVLLHDFYGSSVEAALEIADSLTSQGYEFVTVDELILE